MITYATAVAGPVTCTECGATAKRAHRIASGATLCGPCFAPRQGELHRAWLQACGVAPYNHYAGPRCEVCDSPPRANGLVRAVDEMTGTESIVCRRGYCLRRIVRGHPKRFEPFIGPTPVVAPS